MKSLEVEKSREDTKQRLVEYIRAISAANNSRKSGPSPQNGTEGGDDQQIEHNE